MVAEQKTRTQAGAPVHLTLTRDEFLALYSLMQSYRPMTGTGVTLRAKVVAVEAIRQQRDGE